MYSRITKIYYKKTIGHVFTKPVQIEGYVKDQVFVPRLPRDLPDLKTQIISAVKNLTIISVCAVSPVVHTSNISSCQKKKFFSFAVAVNNSIKVGPLVFLL